MTIYRLDIRVLIFACLCTGCSSLSSLFYEPPPKTYLAVRTANVNTSEMLGAVCIDEPSDRSNPILPVLVGLVNDTQTAWTVDSSQISSQQWLSQQSLRQWFPIPPDEAAREAPVTKLDAAAAIADKIGVFAAYGAALGAAGGAFTARAKGDEIDNGFDLGASFGAVALGGVGAIVEYLRLTRSYETNEAGEMNEKMKILALKDKNILYSGYSTIGYVYFPRRVRPFSGVQANITIRFVRGDPSKDWLPPSYENIKDKPQKRRPEWADYSPLVCKCSVNLDPCQALPSVRARDPRLDDFHCEPANENVSDGRCNQIISNQNVSLEPLNDQVTTKTLHRCSPGSFLCPQ